MVSAGERCTTKVPILQLFCNGMVTALPECNLAVTWDWDPDDACGAAMSGAVPVQNFPRGLCPLERPHSAVTPGGRGPL